MRKIAKDVSLVKSLSSVAAAEGDDEVRCYASHLIDPMNTNPCGVPVQMNGQSPTATINTSMSFDVTVDTLNGPADDQGRFGFVVQPVMGDSSNPLYFKVAQVDTTQGTGWPQDLSQPSAYLRNAGSTALTVDPQSRTLLQGPAMMYKSNGASTLLTEGPLGDPAIYNVSGVTDDQWNPKVGGAQIMINNPTSSIVSLPPGQYSLNYIAAFTPNQSAGSVLQVIPLSSNASASNEGQTGGTGDDAGYSSNWILSVYDHTAQFQIKWSIQPNEQWNMEFQITTSWARPDNLATPAVNGYPLDGGPVRKYVPVAMSVLATFISSDFIASGDIACAQVTGTVCQTDVFTDVARTQAGNPLKVEALRNFPLHYDGKLKDGVYQIWTPESMDDMNLKSPSLNKAHDYPCLIVSGKVATPNPSASVVVLRVFISTTYQFTSDTKCFDMRLHQGSTAIAEKALRLVQTFPRSSANGPHLENIRRFFSKVGAGAMKAINWVGDNRDAIASGLKMGLSLLA